MPIDGVRFGHVAFKVADVEKSIRWYGDAFGAKVIYRVDRITGKGRVWGQGEYAPEAFLDIDDPEERARIMVNTKAGAVDDPSNYGTGAQWRLTLDYDF